MKVLPDEGGQGEGTEGDEGEQDETQTGAEAVAAAGEGEAETLAVAIGRDPETPEADDAEIMAPVDGQPPSQTIQELRRKARDDAKALRKLEAERDAAIAASVAQPAAAAPQVVAVGEKPTFESCGYDAEKLETEMAAWLKRTADAETAQRERAKAAEADQADYNTRLDAYKVGKGSLKVSNFDAAEKVVVAALSPLQQSVIIKHAKNSALLIFAIGNDPAKLKELAAIKDPIEFGIKAMQLETEIRTVKSKFKPEGAAPSGAGSGAPAVGGDALERARQVASKTGNYTEVTKIKREMRAAQRKA